MVFYGKAQGLELGAEIVPGLVCYSGLVKIGEDHEVFTLALRPEVGAVHEVFDGSVGVGSLG